MRLAKSFLRNFKHHTLFMIISLIGLIIGLSSCLYIYLWVQHETSYDTFHADHKSIFRVEQEYFENGQSEVWPITSAPFGPTLVDEFAEIEQFTRFWRQQYSVVDKNEILHSQELFIADNGVFEFFNFNLEQGDPKRALTEPESVVLTNYLAMKYFGKSDVVGQSITLLIDGQREHLKVTGVMAPVPKNSHIQFEMLLSASTFEHLSFMKRWDGNFLYTYIKLNKEVVPSDLERKFTKFATKYRKSSSQILKEGESFDDYLKIRLKNITDIHLRPTTEWEIGPQGSSKTVFIFSSIALLVLIIAGINFTNLSIAQVSKRAKEVGIRKSIGAVKNQLMIQFLGESVLTCLIAALASLIVVYVLLPRMNELSDKEFMVYHIFQPKVLIWLLLTTLCVSILSGIYPTLYLIQIKTVDVLKGLLKVSRHSSFKTSLITAQFIIAIALIICTMTMNAQLEFMRNKSLGFDQENVIILSTVNFTDEDYDRVNTFKTRLINNPKVRSVSVSSSVPGELRYGDGRYTLEETGESYSLTHFTVDYDFLDTYDIQLISGRNFSMEFGSDTSGNIIVNEAATKLMGLTPGEAVGKKLRNNPIVGVVKDFNFKSLKRNIEPLALILYPKRIDYISVKLLPGDLSVSLQSVQEVYDGLFSDQFSYSFLDQKLNTLYRSDQKSHQLFTFFSSLSLVLALMGLFGLTAFRAEESVKEMGIRKVLGASMYQISSSFLGEFSRLIIASVLFSWPLAYLFLRNWLSGFVYRTEISPWTFVIAASLTTGIAILTIVFQAIRIAKLNPVVTLRNE